MTDTVMYRFVVKRDTAANFTAANTLLLQGEFGLETDTKKMKMGDGSTLWNSLGYCIPSGGSGGSANITADTHPFSPTAWDDEFEFGSAIDTTGARAIGANGWTVDVATGSPTVNQGALHVPPGGSIRMHQAAPGSGPWTFATKLALPGWYGSASGVAAWLVVTGSAHVAVFGLGIDGSSNAGLFLDQFTTSFSYVSETASDAGVPWENFLAAGTYLGVNYDGTDLNFYYGGGVSAGPAWRKISSQVASSYVGTITDVGLWMYDSGATAAGGAWCDWFRRTA